MGKIFGELAKVRGVVYYRLSPNEQRPFAGMISHGLPNMYRRVKNRIFRVAPPTIAAYLLYKWAVATNRALNRKNPKDYENDT